MENNILTVSLKEYKKQIEDLKGSLLGLDKGSEQYQKTLKKIQDMQAKLNSVLQDTKKGADAATGSYRAIQQQVSELTKANKELEGGLTTNSEAFRKNAEVINELNNKLKEADAQMGYFQRNVGDYANQFKTAMGEMQSGPAGVVQGILNLGDALKGLQTKFGGFGGAVTAAGKSLKTGFVAVLDVIAKHPIVAAFTALAALIMKVASNFTMSAKASQSFHKAAGALEPIMNVINRLIGKLVDWLSDVAIWMAERTPKAMQTCGKAMNWLGGVIATLIRSVGYLPTVMSQVFASVVKVIGQGVTKAGGILGDFVSMFDEELGNKISKSIANASRTVSDFVQGYANSVKGIVNGAANAIESLLGKGANAMNQLAKESQQTMKLRGQENEARNETIKLQNEESKNELQIAKLRDKAAKTNNPQDRIKYLTQANELIKRNGQLEVQIAQTEYEIIKQNNALTTTSIEDKEKEEEAQRKMIDAQTQYTLGMASLDKQITRNQSTAERAAAAKAKAAEEQAKKEAAAAKKAAKDKEKAEEDLQKKLEQLRKEAEKDAKQYYAVLADLAQDELDKTLEGSRDYYKYQKQLIDANYNYQRVVISQEVKDQGQRNEKLKQLQFTYNLATLKNTQDARKAEVKSAVEEYQALAEIINNVGAKTEYLQKAINAQRAEASQSLVDLVDNAKVNVEHLSSTFNMSLEETNLFLTNLKDAIGNAARMINSGEAFDEAGGEPIDIIYQMMGLPAKSEWQATIKQLEENLNKYAKGFYGDVDENVVKERQEFIAKQQDEFDKTYKKFDEHIQQIMGVTATGLAAQIIKINHESADGLVDLMKQINDSSKQIATNNLIESLSQPLEDFYETVSKNTGAYQKLNEEINKDVKNDALKEKWNQDAKAIQDYLVEMKKVQQSQNIQDANNPELAEEQRIANKKKYEDEYRKTVQESYNTLRSYEFDHLREVEQLAYEEEVIRLTAEKATDHELAQLRRKHQKTMASIDKKQLKSEQSNWEKSNKIIGDVSKVYSMLGSNVTSILDTIATAKEEQIQQDYENGKITEEQAKEQFKTVKALQRASCIVDTLGGAIAAYAAAQELGPIAGPIVGGINAGLVTTMGILELTQINQTEWDGASSISDNTSTPTAVDFSAASVNPLLDSISDMDSIPTVNVANSEDSKVYILQSDITKSNNQVSVRESNSTF